VLQKPKKKNIQTRQLIWWLEQVDPCPTLNQICLKDSQAIAYILPQRKSQQRKWERLRSHWLSCLRGNYLLYGAALIPSE